jgi:putative glutamine amidotransferase
MDRAGMSARIPRIGVTSTLGGGRYMWWFYWLSMRLFGEHPIRLVAPAGESQLDGLDGLIIGGGDDISVELYDGELTLDVKYDEARDKLELKALEYAAKRDLPVLGVCRGAQMLNVFYGGTLHQDIYKTYAGLPRRWTPLPARHVTIDPDSLLYEVLEVRHLHVNALHTQSVDKLGSGLAVTARDRHDVVQAIEDRSAYFRVGVQWHPEFMIYRASQRRLFRAFVHAVDAKSGSGLSRNGEEGSAVRRPSA